MNIYPYVYRIDHPVSGEFYIGSRSVNKVPALEDFGHIYKTSTKKLAHPFEEYTQTILAEFYLPTGADDAYDFEQLTIFENWGDPLLVNEHCTYGKARWSRVGMKLSEETKRKMSVARSANPYTHNVETRQKISEALRGKTLSDETRARMSKTRCGKTHSAESKAKISEALRGKTHSDESKAKISEALRGKPCSAETKAKISATRRGKKLLATHWSL